MGNGEIRFQVQQEKRRRWLLFAILIALILDSRKEGERLERERELLAIYTKESI